MGLFNRKAAPATAAPAEPIAQVTLPDGCTYTISRIVDVLGDSCPRPQLMTKKALNEAISGAVIEVRVDNPTSMEALPTVMAAVNGTHLATVKADRYWRVFVCKN
ncbi:sulfurtransferase TusA family protein [Acidiferrobacter sp.]|uniref:sulfurtransferase TusA family protein n=1 Tax=Acidiferrobacter sp. TaxID=1872107 RepID=UPI0026309369|nr:sulfurtransferase TusA family protein [Acidiferrobacter sp.]